MVTFPAASRAIFHMLPEGLHREKYDQLVHESGKAAAESGFPMLDSRRASSIDETMIRCPVMVAGSEHDRMVPVGIVRKIAVKYSADYFEIAGHGHWVTEEPGWEEIAGTVERWIRKKVG